MKRISLYMRLTIIFLSISAGSWLVSAFFSWNASRNYLNDSLDGYQQVLAEQLSTINWDEIQHDAFQKNMHLFPWLFYTEGYDGKKETIGFAIFDSQGERVFDDGKNGQKFLFHANAQGFIIQDIIDEDNPWRVFWIHNSDSTYIIAVGQELKYREKAAWDLAWQSLFPWIVGLLFLLLASVIFTREEFKPLRYIVRDLSIRHPDDLNPIQEKNIPVEVEPLIKAMNGLFLRVKEMINRERSFIADASHELRSPLAALKVQAEVAIIAGSDGKTRNHALRQLIQGIDRSSRLIDQLLLMSRLDVNSDTATEDLQNVELDWFSLLQEAVHEHIPYAKSKGINIEINAVNVGPVTSGNPEFWVILLKNLLGNAVRYSPANTEVHVSVEDAKLTVSNVNMKLHEDELVRLGERFFRPPGQTESGSGLGLSIVKRIASIYHCTVSFNINSSGIITVIVEPENP